MAGGSVLRCPHPECPDYAVPRSSNVRSVSRYGSGGWDLLRCHSCGRTFSERRWSPFFRLLIPEGAAMEVLRRVGSGQSMRAAAKDVGVDKNTAMRIIGLGTRHLRWFEASMTSNYRWDPATAERVTAFLRAKAKRDRGQRPERRRSFPADETA